MICRWAEGPWTTAEIILIGENGVPRLEVNVDHVATLRQARMGPEPDPVTVAALAELAGADGIIVDLREDRRHIQDRDLLLLRQTVQTRLNLEMAATPEMLEIATEVKPALGVGANWVELHTGTYAEAESEKEAQRLFEELFTAARHALSLGLRVKCGHGLNYTNIKPFRGRPEFAEFST